MEQFEVITITVFDEWLGGLKDRTSRLAIYNRLTQFESGNFGITRNLGK